MKTRQQCCANPAGNAEASEIAGAAPYRSEYVEYMVPATLALAGSRRDGKALTAAVYFRRPS